MTPVPPVQRLLYRPLSPARTTTLVSVAALGFALLGPRRLPAQTVDGRTQVSSGYAPAVAWRATGGGIDRRGLYTSGPRSGRYVVIANAGPPASADTARVTVAQPPSVAPAVARAGPAPSARARGIPFGYYGDWQAARGAGQTMFSLTVRIYRPEEIVDQIAQARSQGRHLLLAMAGGAHRLYKTAGVFDYAKWLARMSEYNTTAIRQAIADGVADGTVVGNIVMDEPHNTTGENSWGPKGTMTKARVDTMCAYVKGIFPTLPVGVVHDHDVFEPKRDYRSCEFLLDQYAARKGPVTEFRDAGLALTRRDNMAIIFSLNLLDGGLQAARDGAWECPFPATGGRGTFAPNCRMTAEQVREFGAVLGPAGCALTMWRYDPKFMSDPDNQRAFADIAARLAGHSAPSCGRP